MNTTGLDQAPTPHLGAWFKVMLLEVIKQAEWGHEVGQKLLAHEGNIWTDLQLLSSHAGSAAAFIDTLGSRKAALEKAFPGRGQTLRDVCDTSYDFAAVLELRNAIAHIDERFEQRWQQLAREDSPAPVLTPRSSGLEDPDRESIVHIDENLMVVSVLRMDGSGRLRIDVAELTAELHQIQIAASHVWMTLHFHMSPRELGEQLNKVIARADALSGEEPTSGDLVAR